MEAGVTREAGPQRATAEHQQVVAPTTSSSSYSPPRVHTPSRHEASDVKVAPPGNPYHVLMVLRCGICGEPFEGYWADDPCCHDCDEEDEFCRLWFGDRGED